MLTENFLEGSNPLPRGGLLLLQTRRIQPLTQGGLASSLPSYQSKNCVSQNPLPRSWPQFYFLMLTEKNFRRIQPLTQGRLASSSNKKDPTPYPGGLASSLVQLSKQKLRKSTLNYTLADRSSISSSGFLTTKIIYQLSLISSQISRNSAKFTNYTKLQQISKTKQKQKLFNHLPPKMLASECPKKRSSFYLPNSIPCAIQWVLNSTALSAIFGGKIENTGKNSSFWNNEQIQEVMIVVWKSLPTTSRLMKLTSFITFACKSSVFSIYAAMNMCSQQRPEINWLYKVKVD